MYIATVLSFLILFCVVNAYAMLAVDTKNALSCSALHKMTCTLKDINAEAKKGHLYTFVNTHVILHFGLGLLNTTIC